MPRKDKLEWPVDKPLPKFSSEEEEIKFWHSWSFSDHMEKYGEKEPDPPEPPFANEES